MGRQKCESWRDKNKCCFDRTIMLVKESIVKFMPRQSDTKPSTMTEAMDRPTIPTKYTFARDGLYAQEYEMEQKNHVVECVHTCKFDGKSHCILLRCWWIFPWPSRYQHHFYFMTHMCQLFLHNFSIFFLPNWMIFSKTKPNCCFSVDCTRGK